MLNMKRPFQKMAISLMAVGLLVTGVSVGATAFAASTEYEATATPTDSNYTVEEMLAAAIEAEYLAQAEYNAIMNTFGVQRPYSNMIKAEANHISLLTSLLKEYGVTIPDKDWASLVTVPASLDLAYEAGITAEKNSITMYENFLNKDIPADVKDVFTSLLTASERHLTSFERQKDGDCTGDGNGFNNGNGKRNGRRMGGAGNGNGGCGQGNNGILQGSCILD